MCLYGEWFLNHICISLRLIFQLNMNFMEKNCYQGLRHKNHIFYVI